MRSAIYRRRWQYHAPWTLTRPWLPRVARGADEWCNPSVYVVTPLGSVVVFWRPGSLRTEQDGPCADCLADDERDRAQGWNVIRDKTPYHCDDPSCDSCYNDAIDVLDEEFFRAVASRNAAEWDNPDDAAYDDPIEKV